MKLCCMCCGTEVDLGFEVVFDGDELTECMCVCDGCRGAGADDGPRVTRRYFPVRDP